MVNIGDAEIPALGLGTWELKGNTAATLVQEALEIGYEHVDTAQAYENEEEVGKGIKAAGIDRDSLFLTTKVWYTNLGKQNFGPSVEDSLRKLKCDYVDLLLIHWPNDEIPLGEMIEELVKVQDRQLTRYIGVSNFPVQMVKDTLAMGADIITNQVEYHPFIDQSELYGFLRENNIALTAYSPIARGKVIGHPLLDSIGKKYGKSEVQISLRWLIEQEGVIVIPRTSKPARLATNMEIFDFWLSEEESVQIDALRTPEGRLVDPSWAPQWD